MSFTIRLAFRYLWARKTRSFLTTLAIVFGVMIIFGLNGMLPAIEKSFQQNITAASGQVDLSVTSETQGVFDSALANKVGHVSGVAHATPLLTRPVIVPPTQALKNKDGQSISSFKLTGVDPKTIGDVHPLRVTKGRALSSADTNSMLITTTLADTTGLKVGDTITLPSGTGETKFSIVGLVEQPPVPGSEELYVPLTAAQALFNQTGKINMVEARFSSGGNSEEVRRTVLSALGGGFKLGGAESGSEFLASLQLSQLLLSMLGALSLAMGGFIIFNTFRTIVVERRKDIAMLRAVGASRKTVLGLILVESLLQGVIGTAIGLGAGYVMVISVLAVLRPFYESLIHLTIGGPIFEPATYVAAIGLGIGVTVLSGLLPARRASLVSPLEALRPPTAEATGRLMSRSVVAGVVLLVVALLGLASGNIGLASLGAVLFLAGLVLAGPALVKPISALFAGLLVMAFAREGQIAEGNLTRHPHRAAITASALMIGLAIIIAFAGMMTSVSSGFMSYIDKSLRADYILMPQSLVLGGGNVGAGPDLVKRIHGVPGIAGVTTLRFAATNTGKADLQVLGINPVEYPKISGLEFSSGDPDAAYSDMAAGRSMIVNGIFASKNGVKVGQRLTLKTPRGPKTYKVVGIGMDYLNAKVASGYISQDNLKRDFNETADLLIMANRKAGANAAQVKSALKHIVKDYPAFTLFSAEEFRQSQVQIFKSAFIGFDVLILVLAIPSFIALLNTLGINVLERTREIGMMRAIGTTRRQVRRLILAESLLLSIVGIAFGILAGVWLGYILVSGMNISGFKLPYFFPYGGILMTIAAGLLIGVVAALGPARHAARLNIVSALQYE